MILIADSGSTKTDWALTDGGRVVKRVATQGINPFHQNAAIIHTVLTDELLPHLTPTIREVYFYGSGCRPEVVQPMVATLRLCFADASRIEVHGDLLGAARALCGHSEGIACILGTGANSGLYDGTSIVRNTPPLGYILGDEGSGAVLGIRFLNALYKGMLPTTVADAFFHETQTTMEEAIARVYRQPLANRWLSSLSTFIARHVDNPQVRGLVVDNFRLFFRRNVVQYGRRDLPVAAVGSIAWYYKPLLTEAASMEGFAMGTVSASPMEGLLAYHAGLN